MRCQRCGDKGLIRVQYHSGEPFDVAICDCRTGQPWRVGGEELVRARYQLGPEHQVAYREEFEGEEPAVHPPAADFLSAAQVKPKL